jgi:HEPN domain-containing protein
MNPETKRWFAQAEHDLDNAQRTLDAELWDLCTFTAQQAAEKALKALILEQTGSPPPRVHSIQKLGGIAGVASLLPRKALALDDYYVGARYPDAVAGLPYESLGMFEASSAVDAAKEILELVRKELGE